MKIYISEELTFTDSSIDAYGQQVDMILKAYDFIKTKKEQVGYVRYTIFRNEIYIQMIEVYSEYKRKGYAEKMLKWLINEYSEYEIYPGMTTEEGTPFIERMYKKGILKKKEPINNHLELNPIYKKLRLTSVKAANFLKALVKQGFKAYDKLKNKSDIDGIDTNDLYDISQWIKGSVTNNNFSEDKPPHWVYDYLKEMKAL